MSLSDDRWNFSFGKEMRSECRYGASYIQIDRAPWSSGGTFQPLYLTGNIGTWQSIKLWAQSCFWKVLSWEETRLWRIFCGGCRSVCYGLTARGRRSCFTNCVHWTASPSITSYWLPSSGVQKMARRSCIYLKMLKPIALYICKEFYLHL